VLGHHHDAVALCGSADDCAIERSPHPGPDDRSVVGCPVVRGSFVGRAVLGGSVLGGSVVGRAFTV
jgi:hypothetical protein